MLGHEAPVPTASGITTGEPIDTAGTRGGLTGTFDRLQWKYADLSALPPRPVEREATPGRSYNAEQYPWQEESWSLAVDEPSTQSQFYRALYQTLRQGHPLAITPQSVRRQIEIIHRCRQLCPDIEGDPR